MEEKIFINNELYLRDDDRDWRLDTDVTQELYNLTTEGDWDKIHSYINENQIDVISLRELMADHLSNLTPYKTYEYIDIINKMKDLGLFDDEEIEQLFSSGSWGIIYDGNIELVKYFLENGGHPYNMMEFAIDASYDHDNTINYIKIIELLLNHDPSLIEILNDEIYEILQERRRRNIINVVSQTENRRGIDVPNEIWREINDYIRYK